MKRGILLSAILVVVLAGLVGSAASYHGLDYGWFYVLTWGWTIGLYHLVDGLRHEPIAVGIGLAALCLLPFALLRLLRGVSPTEASKQFWRFRQAAAIAGGFVAVAMSSIALLAAIHAVHWLFYPKEPLLGNHARRLEDDKLTMHSIAIGVHNYLDVQGKSDGQQALPSGGTLLEDGRVGHGWMVPILPYVNAGHLTARLDLKKPWNESPNKEVYQNDVPHEYINSMHTASLWYDPSGKAIKNAEGYITSDFAANERVMPFGRSLRLKDIVDGTSNTLLIGEAAINPQPWGSPFNGRDPAIGLNRSPQGFNGAHPGVVVFARVDGSVVAIPDSINPLVLRAISTPDGGEY